MKAALLLIALGAASVQAGETSLKCRLIKVSRSGAPPERFFIQSGNDRKEEVGVSRTVDADPVEVSLSEGGSLRFFDGEGAVVGQAEIPDGAGVLNIFLLPDAESEEGEATWRFIALDAEPMALDKGGVVVVNGATSDAKATVGEAGKELSSGQSAVFADPGPKDNYKMVPLRVEMQVGGRWRPVKDGASKFLGDTVYWMVLFEDFELDRPRLSVFKGR